jgi:hypothetical protein
MPPTSIEMNPIQPLDYRDGSRDRASQVRQILRWMAGSLALSSAVTAVMPLWIPMPPVAYWGIPPIAVVGFVLRTRGTNRLIPLRSAWILGVVMFGLWGLAALLDQFHGRPPYYDRYLAMWWGISCAAAIAGLILDTKKARVSQV